MGASEAAVHDDADICGHRHRTVHHNHILLESDMDVASIAKSNKYDMGERVGLRTLSDLRSAMCAGNAELRPRTKKCKCIFQKTSQCFSNGCNNAKCCDVRFHMRRSSYNHG